MLPFESHMQELVLRVKDLYDENQHIVVSSGSGPHEAWPSDADLKRKAKPVQTAVPRAAPSSSVDVQRQQEQKREQVQQRQSHKQKQLLEAREWLAQQQQQQQPGNGTTASSSCSSCVAAELCTFWKVGPSTHMSTSHLTHNT
jgi:hypothetical protein